MDKYINAERLVKCIQHHPCIEAAYYTLLDEHHLLTFSTGATALAVYRMPTSNSDASSSTSDPDVSPICFLALPQLAPDYVYHVRENIAIRSHHTAFPDCAPPFEPDLAPERTLVAIPYLIKSLSHKNPRANMEAGPPPRSYLLLFPAEIVLAHARRFVGGTVEPGVVSWDEWGPAGTTTLALAGYLFAVSVCGSRALLLLQLRRSVWDVEEDAQEEVEGEKEEEVYTLIVDAHPYAAVHTAAYRGHVGGGGTSVDDGIDAEHMARLVVPPEEVEVRMRRYSPNGGPGRPGRYPCRVRYRKVQLGTPTDEITSRWPFSWLAILTDDTFGILVSYWWVQSSRSG